MQKSRDLGLKVAGLFDCVLTPPSPQIGPQIRQDLYQGMPSGMPHAPPTQDGFSRRMTSAAEATRSERHGYRHARTQIGPRKHLH